MSTPAWLQHPDDPLAPKAMTEDVRETVMREQLEVIAHSDLTDRTNKLDDGEYADMLAELADNPSFLARVEAETLRRTAQVRDVATHSIEGQAVAAAQTGYYGYHPQHYRSVEDMLQDNLQETTYGTTEFYNLRTVIQKILPYCMAHGIEVPENLWSEETKSKTRYMADYLGPRLREGGDGLDETVAGIMSSVVDHNVSLQSLREQFPPTPASGLPSLDVLHFLQPTGGVVLVHYDTEAQRQLLERQLGRRAIWHLGDGTENILQALVRRRGRE